MSIEREAATAVSSVIFWSAFKDVIRKVGPKVAIWGATILGQQLLIKYIHQHILKDDRHE